jgi:CRP-like cAMP-binding protein
MHSLFIQTFKKLAPASEKDILDIVARFRPKTFLKNATLVEQGKLCTEIFFINSGMIRTFVNYDGTEVTNWVALPGTIETSAQSFIKKIPSPFHLQALTDTDVLAIKRDDYYSLLRENHLFNDLVLKMMEDFYLRMEDKFYSYLFLSAEARLRKMQQQFPEHFKVVPLKYLASILRIQPATLSRLRKKIAN